MINSDRTKYTSRRIEKDPHTHTNNYQSNADWKDWNGLKCLLTKYRNTESMLFWRMRQKFLWMIIMLQDMQTDKSKKDLHSDCNMPFV